MLFDVRQSLPLLILFAFLSGIFLTLSTASAHIQAHSIERLSRRKERKSEESDSNPHEDKWEGKEEKKKWMDAAYVTKPIFAVLGGITSLVGPWFGPVSLYSPIRQVSRIFSGLIVFSYILKNEEKPSKDTTVGSYIIMSSAIALIFVGAEIRVEPYDVEAIMADEATLICGGMLLLVAILITFPIQFLLGCTPVRTPRKFNFLMLLTTETVHSVVATSSSKFLPILSGRLFVFNVIILVLSSFTIVYSSILRSTIIKSQSYYLPLMLNANIFLNGIVGLVIWKDKIMNIGAYVCTFFYFAMGLYLVSAYEVLPGTFVKENISLIPERARSLLAYKEKRLQMQERHELQAADEKSTKEETTTPSCNIKDRGPNDISVGGSTSTRSLHSC